MAVEGAVIGLNASNLVDTLSAIPGLSTVVKLGQIAIVVVIFYIGFLIFKGIMQLRYAYSMKKLIETVESIDKKLGLLVGKNKKK